MVGGIVKHNMSICIFVSENTKWHCKDSASLFCLIQRGMRIYSHHRLINTYGGNNTSMVIPMEHWYVRKRNIGFVACFLVNTIIHDCFVYHSPHFDTYVFSCILHLYFQRSRVFYSSNTGMMMGSFPSSPQRGIKQMIT